MSAVWQSLEFLELAAPAYQVPPEAYGLSNSDRGAHSRSARYVLMCLKEIETSLEGVVVDHELWSRRLGSAVTCLSQLSDELSVWTPVHAAVHSRTASASHDTGVSSVTTAIMQTVPGQKQVQAGAQLVATGIQTLGSATGIATGFTPPPTDAVAALVFAATIKVAALQAGQHCLIPAGFYNQQRSAYTVIVVSRTGLGACCLAVVNTSPLGSPYHPFTIGSAENGMGTLYRDALIVLEDVDFSRVSHSAFWCMAYASLLYPGGGRNVECFYSRVLAFLNEKPFYQNWNYFDFDRVENKSMNAGDFEVPSIRKEGVGQAYYEPRSFRLRAKAVATRGRAIDTALGCLHYLLGFDRGLGPLECRWVTEVLVPLGMILRLTREFKTLGASTFRRGHHQVLKLILRRLGSSVSLLLQDTGTCTVLNPLELADLTKSVIQMALDAVQTSLTPQEINLGAGSPCFPAVLSAVQTEQKVQSFNSSYAFPFFGPFRFDYADSSLAAGTPVPPALVIPVDIMGATVNLHDKRLIRITSFDDFCMRLRRVVDADTVMHNQQALLEHSAILRYHLVRHTVLTLLPGPLPLDDPSRPTLCFYESESLSRSCQIELLRLLFLMTRSLIVSSLALKATRTLDAERIVLLSKLSAVSDAVLRKVAFDAPSPVSLHLAGTAPGPKGLLKPFGIDASFFAEQSEFFLLLDPVAAVCRGEVLDYFRSVKSVVPRHQIIFQFEQSLTLHAELQLLAQISLGIGYQAQSSPVILGQCFTGEDAYFLEVLPEFAFYRDIVLYFKAFCCPNVGSLPPAKQWSLSDTRLMWSCHSDFRKNRQVNIKAFGKPFECLAYVDRKRKSKQDKNSTIFTRFMDFFGGSPSRAPLSAADPTNLVKDKAPIGTEEDVLHVKSLPTFNGRLSQSDVELLLQYLTAPYLRIPLLLQFFTDETRFDALVHPDLQHVLLASLFEPSLWLPTLHKAQPATIPPDSREYLATPLGLLFNELTHSPYVVLDCLESMLEMALDKDTGKFIGSSAELLLFVIRMLIYVDRYVLVLLRHGRYWEHVNRVLDQEGPVLEEEKCLLDITRSTDIKSVSGHTSCARGLRTMPEVRANLQEIHQQLRHRLNQQVLPLLEAWAKRAVEVAELHAACRLHAHISLLCADMAPAEFNLQTVSILTVSTLFVLAHHRFTVEAPKGQVESSQKDPQTGPHDTLGVADMELYGILQNHRRTLVTWLRSNPSKASEVFAAAVRTLTFTGTRTEGLTGEALSWSELRTFCGGRFGPFSGLVEVMNAAAPTILDDMECRVAEDMDEGPSKKPSGIGTLISAIMPRARSGLKEENIESTKAKECLEQYEAWLGWVTGQLAETEIDLQRGKYSLRRNRMEVLELWVNDFADFVDIFGEVDDTSSFQCALISATRQRFWCRLVGYRHDLIRWQPLADPPRSLMAEPIPFKAQGKHSWVGPILDPWRCVHLPSAALMVDRADPVSSCVVRLSTDVVPPSADPDVRQPSHPVEIMVHRHPPRVELFTIHEHGRRLYRVQVYSSNCHCSARSYIGDKMVASSVWEGPQVALLEGGSTVCLPPPRQPSLVLTRQTTPSLGTEVFVPRRLLEGLVPSCLLSIYEFWQRANAGVHFTEDARTSVLVGSSGEPDSFVSIWGRIPTEDLGVSGSKPTALQIRILPTSELSQQAFIENKSQSAYPGEACAIITRYSLNQNSAPADAPESERSFIDLALADRSNAQDWGLDEEAALSLLNLDQVDPDFLPLVDTLLRVEEKSHILVWGPPVTLPGNPTDLPEVPLESSDLHVYGKQCFTVLNQHYRQAWRSVESAAPLVELIEMPRLGLTFRATPSVCGLTDKSVKVKYFCDQHAGLYVSYRRISPASLTANLIRGLQNSLLLENNDGDFFLLVSATAKPVRVTRNLDLETLTTSNEGGQMSAAARLALSSSLHQADSLADQSRTEHLLASLSPSIVLDCSNKEWLANLGCLSPKAIPTMNALNPPAKSDDWSAQDVVVVRTHLYPVHSSRSFLFTTTVGAGLYLVIQRFMARMYADVWRLMESSALFSGEPPTIEEKQLWQSLDSLNASYDFHPDAHATRLKIFLTAHRQGLVAISQSSNQMRKNVTKRLRQVTGRTKRRRTSIPAAKSQTSKTPPKDSDSFSLLPSWSLEEDLLCYLVKLSYVHANCRLSLAELRALIDLAGPQWTQSVENHPLTGNRLQTVQYYIHLAEGSRELQELSFRTPKIPEVTDFDGHVDESCIETSGSIADGLQAIMGAVVHFKPPDRPLTGVEALDYYLDLINRRPLNASTDFFTLYCLLTGQVQVSVLPHEGPYMWGVLATRLVGTWAKSSAMSALRVLASHPEIIQQMPPIPREKGKTRAWRDSFVFKQSEPVQKFYESLFGTLRSLHEGGQLRFRTNVKPCPSMAVPSWVLLMDPDCRTFRTSSLSSDFGCESRRLRPVNVASLCRKFHMDVPPGDPEKSSLPYITKSLLATLAEKPLPFTSQHALVSDVKGSSPGREAMDLPNRLKNHISAATRVGRETIKRFSAEIQAVQQLSKVAKPGQMSFLQLEEVERSLDSPEALAKVVQYAEMLKALLTKTFLQDGRFVDAGIKLVAQFANSARHVSSPDQLHYARSYEVGVLTGSEPVASFDALVTLLMSQSAETAIQRFNPFLSAEMTSDILSLVGTVLLIVNRRSQSARCLHDVIDLLENLARYPLSVDSAEREKLVSSTKMLSKSLATNLSQARHYAHTGQDDTVGDFVDWQTLGWSQDHTSLFDKSCFVALDPRFLVFEFAYNILLRKSQVELISKFVAAVKEGRSVCHQMIMGAGKTTVVGPLLALLLADGNRLVTQVCPHSLLEFTRAVVREKFSAVICKSVVTFQFSRSSNLTRDTLLQLHHARDNKSVVMASPTSLKSLFLKVLQLLDILETSASNMTEVDRVVVKGQQQIVRLRNVLGKVIGVRPAGSLRKPTRDDGILAAQVSSGQPLTEPQIRSVRRELDLALQALDLFTGGCLILDEVHILLHPFKSELHWPIGAKVPLDFTVASKDGAAEDHVEESGLRWQLVWHLYDAIFYFSTGKITCCAEHPRTKAVLENVKSVLVDGISLRAWQTTPHGILLSQAFYQQSLKPVLAQWALIFLESKGYKPRDAELVMNYICLPMAVDPSSDALAGQVMRRVDHQYRGSGAKLLNLTRMWLNSLLPHSLGKVNRVSFGLLLPSEVDPTANTPPTRQLLAVPFVGKDAPSLASEFSHPDVLIALTIAAYRLQGLRHSDFLNAISNLLEEVASSSASGMKISESRPVREFRRWVESAGGRVRGTKRVAASLSVSEDEEDLQTMTAEMLLGRYPRPPDVADRGGLDNTITMDAVTFNRLWSLELVDLLESDQVDTLYRLLWNEPLVIKHLLLYIVFPLCMEHTSLQLSACGQELGGNLIFKNRVGFSGTPSDMLPIEFGRCQFESGTDGTMLSLLTNPSVMHCIVLPTNWSVMSFLQEVANSAPQCLALIDTGALVTGFSNFDVASTLLDLGITVDGVAYLDEDDRQMLLLRDGRRVLKLSQCGLSPDRRFTFYDQVHTQGLDIQQAVNAGAWITLGKDLIFRDFAQGAWRMRRIGEGQVLRVATTPEVAHLVETTWREAKNLRPNETLFNLESPAHPDDVLSMTLGDMRQSKAVPAGDLRPVLQALCGWLILAEIQTDAMQHNLLCVQSVRNIWRKRAYQQLVRRHIEFEVDEVPAALREALDVFRDEVDFVVPTYCVRTHSGHESLKHEVLSRQKLILKERSCLPVDERTDKEIAEFLLKELHEVHVRSTRDSDAYDAYEAQMEAEEEEEEEEEKEQEQQKEQRQEQEQEHVTEEETPQNQKWSRGPTNPHPWTLHDLSRGPWETEAFFPLKDFGVFRKLGKRAKGIGFPEELWVSQNYYDRSWSTSTHRRLKNCSVVMEWIPDSSRESHISLDYHRRFTKVIGAYKRPDGTIPVSKLTSVLLDLDIVEHHADDPSITHAEAQTISRVLLNRISHLRTLPAAEVAALLPRGSTPRPTPPPANQKAIDALFAAPSIPANTLRSRGRPLHAAATDVPLLKSQAATIDLLGLANAATAPRKVNSDLLELDSQPITPVTARSLDAELITDSVTENELTIVLMVEGWQGLLEGPTGGSPLFGRTDNRYYLILSLEEAEGIRASAHVAKMSNLRSPIYPGVRVGLRHVNARFSLIDPLYAPKSSPVGPPDVLAPVFLSVQRWSHRSRLQRTSLRTLTLQEQMAYQCLRFVNSELFFTMRQVSLILRAIPASTPQEKEQWFLEVRKCRRRFQKFALHLPGQQSSRQPHLYNSKTQAGAISVRNSFLINLFI